MNNFNLTSFLQDFCACVFVCKCVCVCAVTPNLSLIIWGIMGILPAMRKGDLISLSACHSCSLSFSVVPSYEISQVRTCHTHLHAHACTHIHIHAHTYKTTHLGRDTLFIKFISCDLTPHCHMDKYTPTQTHWVTSKATCVYSGLDEEVCFPWLMISQAVRAVDRLCWGGLAACRQWQAGLGLLPGLGLTNT